MRTTTFALIFGIAYLAAGVRPHGASAAGDGPAVPDPEFEPADVVSDN